MEADWSVEIGEELPRIVVPWAAEGCSFIDLRSHPEAAASLPETQAYPALTQALIDLNALSSQVFTSKCDVWWMDCEDLDWCEMETTADNAKTGLACYIDLVRNGEGSFASFPQQEAWLRSLTAALRGIPCQLSRVELVLRAMAIRDRNGKNHDGFAVTLYVTGCGRTKHLAERSWDHALAAVVPVLAGAA